MRLFYRDLSACKQTLIISCHVKPVLYQKKSLETHLSGKIRELQCIANKYGGYCSLGLGVIVQNNMTVFLQIPVLSVKRKRKKRCKRDIT